MYTFHKLSGIALLLSSTLLVLTACTKTKHVQEKMPYNDIEAFAIMGYAGDSINAVVYNNDIIIYWSGETNAPATVKPTIAVSPNATITPASGAEVKFSSETVYTVNAEDGTTKTYHLKPVLNNPIPRVYTFSTVTMFWITAPAITINGEYFLSGDTADVQVYAQRLKDGFEFDLPIDYTKISMTSITANLPKYTNMMDTGLHKIWVKIGNRTSEEKQVNIRFPDIYTTNVMHFDFPQAGQPVVAGDSVTIRLWDDHNNDVLKWYTGRFTKIMIENYVFDASALVQTQNSIKFKVPDFPITGTTWSIHFWYWGPFNHVADFGMFLPNSAWPLFPKN